MRIAFVTGSRADWRMIEPLLAAARDSGAVDARLIVTGTHLSPRHGRTLAHITAAGWSPAASVEIVADHDAPLAVARATGQAVTGIAEALAALRPAWTVVAGDRYESFAAGVAATMLGAPLAHIGGGETDVSTNQDCNLRNALTTLAQVHCVAHPLAAARLRALGEQADRVHVTGLPSLDALVSDTRNLQDDAAGDPAIVDHPFILASFLPVTLRPAESRAHLQALLAALAAVRGMHVIFVLSNGDAEGDRHDAAIERWAAGRPHTTLLTDLSPCAYQVALRRCACYVGNSSSGVIETPVYGTPAVIVGSRQDGRPRAPNVRDVRTPTAEQVYAAIAAQLEHGRYAAGSSPWGDGRAAGRVLGILQAARNAADLMSKRLVLSGPYGVRPTAESAAFAELGACVSSD